MPFSRTDNNAIVVEVRPVEIDARCSCACTDALVVLIPSVYIVDRESDHLLDP